ncbi:MAG: DUF547 domain-containing protein [Planctomycetota bacterium]|nr:DUF547 domain-containing protein [Planctomycetota bacterium]
MARLSEANLEALGRDERLALLLNAYNAFTLKLIVERYPLGSIKELPDAERWKAERWTLGGRTLSLDALEHREIRPNFREARVHFALVCAARGCPPLRAEAYDGARLNEQLEDQTRLVHADPRWCRYDGASKTLYLTRLYLWYKGDFEPAGGSLGYARMYLKGLPEDPRIAWLEYDWALNEAPPKP